MKPARRASRILSLVFDSVYVLGGLVAVLVALLRGRLERLRDHLRRRALEAPRVSPSLLPRLWIHAVSVGEIMTVRHLVKRIAETRPEWSLMLSASTRAGVEAARLHFLDHEVISAPIDLGALVDRALDRVRPDAIVIVEHDLWPNFVRHARGRGVPVVLVNARLSPRSQRGYRRLSRVFPWPPRDLPIYVQDETSATAFRELGHRADRLTVTGNLKFDNPPPAAGDVRASLGFESSDRIFLAGSTHEGEEEIVLDTFALLRAETPAAKLWLVPRRIERADEVERLCRERGWSVARWTRDAQRRADVLLVDTVGELARLSSAGDLVFVGGSLVPIGGHNVIEPASFGRPVLIGPHFHNFTSVVESFRREDAIVIAQDAKDFTSVALSLWRDPERAAALGARGRDCVEKNAGAVDRTLAALDRVLPTLSRER